MSRDRESDGVENTIQPFRKSVLVGQFGLRRDVDLGVEGGLKFRGELYFKRMVNA